MVSSIPMERQLQSNVETRKRSNFIKQTVILPQILQMGINLIIIGLWFWLYRPVFSYLTIIFSREDFRTNQIVLIGVIILIVIQLRRERRQLRFDSAPHLCLPAFSLALGGSTFYLICERFLDINTISASLFGLASYGLLGLWLPPQQWRQGLPAALLLIGVLPFGEHIQTFIGYPLRISTAKVVRDGLAAVGVTSIGIDTILVFENGVSQVDLPCSGVKSLWTGMLFLMAATWLERHPLNLRWLLLALGFTTLLIIVNLARVATLVIVGPVAGWSLLAKMLHAPLGVFGFAAACAVTAWLLRLSRTQGSKLRTQGPDLRAQGLKLRAQGPKLRGLSGRLLGLALIIILLVMVLLYSPRPQTGLAQASPMWKFPTDLVTEPMPLKPDEIAWLTRDGAESAERRRFEWRGLTGSMILITSATWRGHHRPERCFEVYGLSLEDSRTYLVNPNFPLRFVSLGDDNHPNLLSATYWFQSADRTIDDYGARIWADLTPRRERWVLVSILFDGVQDPRAEQTQTFYLALHEATARYLKGDRP